MATDFSHQIRVLMCQQCGAPLDADIEGGSVVCDYCGVENHIVPREQTAPPPRDDVDEDVRMNRSLTRVPIGMPIWITVPLICRFFSTMG